MRFAKMKAVVLAALGCLVSASACAETLQACSAGRVAPHERSRTPLIALRGGPSSSVLALRGGGRPSKSDVTLFLNAVISGAYGLGCTLAPSKVVAIYGATEKIGFLHPAHGISQYLGGVQLVFALRCASALGMVGFLPPHGKAETLQDQALLHTAMAVIAGYRTLRGAQFSLLAATASPLPGSLLLAYLSYAASRAAA